MASTERAVSDPIGIADGVSIGASTAPWPRRINTIVFVAAAAVISAGLGTEILVASVGEGTFLQEGRHFDLDEEANVPTWFSAALMAAAGVLSIVISATLADRGRVDRFRWAVLGVVFLAMSLDEVSSFHEAMMEPLRDWLDVGGAFHHAWVVIAIPAVIVFAVLYLPFLWRLPSRTRLGFLLGGSLFVGGALAFEMVGSVVVTEQGEGVAYVLATSIEESLEIAGLAVFFVTLVTFAAASGIRVVAARNP